MPEILEEVQTTVPFTNLRALYLSHNAVLPRELGGNCIYHAHELKRRLVAAGQTARIVQFTGEKHWATVAGTNGDTELYNSAWYTDGPIPLSNLSGAAISHPAFPVRDGGDRAMVNGYVRDRGAGVGLRYFVPKIDAKATGIGSGYSLVDPQPATRVPLEGDGEIACLDLPKVFLTLRNGEDLLRMRWNYPTRELLAGPFLRESMTRVPMIGEEAVPEAVKRSVEKIAELVQISASSLWEIFLVAGDIGRRIQREMLL